MPNTSLPAGTLTAKEVAADLGLAVATVHRKLKDGSIPGGTRLFRDWRIDATTYQAWRDQEFQPKKPADPFSFSPRSPRSEANRRAKAGV